MKIFISLLMFGYSTFSYSYCKGVEVHYKDGKILELNSEQEHERGAKFINRLDFYEASFDGKSFIISKDGYLSVDGTKIKLPEKKIKYTDYYSITKFKDNYFLRLGFDDGVDILVHHLVEIDLVNKKYLSAWTEPTSHTKTYLTLIDGKLSYLSGYYCKEGFQDTVYQYQSSKWNEVKNEKICKEFGKHKEVEFSGFKKVLIKDRNGKRFTTEWIKADKIKCILPTPVPQEEVKRKMREDSKMLLKQYKEKNRKSK